MESAGGSSDRVQCLGSDGLQVDKSVVQGRLGLGQSGEIQSFGENVQVVVLGLKGVELRSNLSGERLG